MLDSILLGIRCEGIGTVNYISIESCYEVSNVICWATLADGCCQSYLSANKVNTLPILYFPTADDLHQIRRGILDSDQAQAEQSMPIFPRGYGL